MRKISFLKALILLIVSVLSMSTLTACAEPDIQERDNALLRGAILPHHNVVANYIDQFYSDIEDAGFERIILISPNHFNIGNAYVQSVKKLSRDVVLDVEAVEALEGFGALAVEDSGIHGEHGLAVHMDYLEKYLPEVPVLPIMLKWKVPQENLDKLVEALNKLDDGKKTLLISSIDFSHFVSEEVAVANDERTMAWLKSWSEGGFQSFDLDDIWRLESSLKMETEAATAMDSPENFYVFFRMMEGAEDLEIWQRTSSASIFDVTDPLQNTSHIFVKVW